MVETSEGMYAEARCNIPELVDSGHMYYSKSANQRALKDDPISRSTIISSKTHFLRGILKLSPAQSLRAKNKSKLGECYCAYLSFCGKEFDFQM